MEKSSADKKNEPHAFSIYNVGGNELWKYKTLLTYETNGDWIPATSDPLWGKGITVWKKLEDGSFDRPTLETFTAELNRQVALAVDDPEITGFKAKRNARGDGDAGVSTLQLMRQSRNKIEKFLKSQPVDDHKDCITAFEKYFEENVPRDMADFSGLPHKPVFGRLPPFQTSSAAEKEGLSEDAIVMPGEDRPGGIQRVVGPHHSQSSVDKVLRERRKMRVDGGRDPTAEEDRIKGKQFYDDGQMYTVLDVLWMSEDTDGNAVKDMVGWYYESNCGVEEAEMYIKEGEGKSLPDGESDNSVLVFSLVPEIEGWIARSTAFTPEQIDQQTNDAQEADLGSLRVADLKRKFVALGLEQSILGRSSTGNILKEHWLEAVRAELARRKEANTMLVIDESWSLVDLKAKAVELGLAQADLALASGQHAGHKRPWIVLLIRKLAEAPVNAHQSST